MNKILVNAAVIVATASMLTSCGGTSHIIDGVKLNGQYYLDNISINGINKGQQSEVVDKSNYATVLQHYKLNTLLFDDVSPDCFQNSYWVLPHNGNGSYTIANNNNCYAGERKIVWSVRTTDTKQKIFQLKILDGMKARKVTSGYIMDISETTASTFTLHSATTYEGQNIDVYYHFSRASQQ